MKEAPPLNVMMSGTPGAGKSTFAHRLASESGLVRLSVDELRTELFGDIPSGWDPERSQLTYGALDYVARQCLEARMGVIRDQQHNRRRYRDRSRAIGEVGVAAVNVFVHLHVPIEQALARVTGRDSQPNQLRYATSEEANYMIAKADNEFEPFEDDEPVVFIPGDLPFEQQHQVFSDTVARLARPIASS